MSKRQHAFYHIGLVQEGRACYGGPIRGADAAVAFVRARFGRSPQEHLVGLYLNVRNMPLGWREIARGTVDANLVHPREVFLPAIKLAASAVVLAHNHPSGDPTPSAEDRAVTQRLTEAGKLLGIELLDHLVVAAEGFTSLKGRG